VDTTPRGQHLLSVAQDW